MFGFGYFVIRTTARLGDDIPFTSMTFIAYSPTGMPAGIRTIATVSSTARIEAFLITKLLESCTETTLENPFPWSVTNESREVGTDEGVTYETPTDCWSVTKVSLSLIGTSLPSLEYAAMK